MTGSLGIVASVGGVTINQTAQKTGDGAAAVQVSLPAGKAGSLTTRTDDNTGVVTLSAGHGLSDGTYDLHWDGGSRAGMTGTVAGNDITLDGGAGSVLPSQGTSVVVTAPVSINVLIDGDELELFAIHCTQQCSADFQDSGDASIERWHLAAEGVDTWHSSSTATNPLSGNIVTHIHASCGSSSTAGTLTVLALYDATP